jgi:WD40 repeat protein/tetratricopeptide (TPR) repeat protein
MAMSTSSGSADYGLFDELAEEFAERYRRGERPSLQEYIDRCPAMGDEIRELFPALVEVEQAEEVLEPQRGPAASPSTPALRQVGDYRVIREVGRGGMGVVYEAEQVSLGRRVALKILPGVVARDHKALERFRREARAAARLHHTNIVPVFEVGQDGDVVFYAMQFIQGQGLDAVIEELARYRQKSGQGSAAPIAAGADMQAPVPLGTNRPESAVAMSRRLASLPVGDRTEALAASLRARQVSRMARSLVAGTFAAETLDPDRTGSSGGVTEPESCDSQPKDPRGWSPPAPSSTSAVLPGGTQVSAFESSGKRLPFFRSAAQIGRQAAQGLAYAHARGIIHRDIKPSNLLLDSAGVVWIADFGLAKADDDGLTASGDILGTIRYMAPERFRGEGDPRADVYALGLTLYELLTLRPGFEGTDRLRMIERIKAEEPVRPRLLDNRIPRDLETIVLKAIDKDPDRRYATADAMAEDLRRYLDDEPVLARRTTALERYARWARRNPGVAVLGAVLTGVLLLVTAGSILTARRFARLFQSERQALSLVESQQAAVIASLKKAEAAGDEARGAEKLARAAEESGRKLLYTTDMQLVPFMWKDPQAAVAQIRSRLNAHDPRQNPSLAGKEDLRGFEWHYDQHLMESGASIFSGHAAPVLAGAFLPDGQLATLDRSGQLRRWDLDLQREQEASRRDLPAGPAAQVLVLSPGGQLAALAEGNKVHVFDTSTGQERFSTNSPDVTGINGNKPCRLVFARDSDWLVMVDDRIRWLSTSSGEAIASLDRKFINTVDLALSADGLTLAVVGHDAFGIEFSVFRLDATTRTVTPWAKDAGLGGTKAASAMSPDGRRIAISSSFTGGLYVHDTGTGRLIAQHGVAHASPISAIAYSGEGLKLATGDTGGTIKVWADPEKLSAKSTPLLALKGHQGAIVSVGFSSDGKRLLSTSADKTARVWDLESTVPAIRMLERSGWSFVVRYSPDGQLIAAADGTSLRLWDAGTGRLVRELSAGGRARVEALAFSPTDHRLLAVGYGGQAGVHHVALWDIDAGTERPPLSGATEEPNFWLGDDTGAIGALAFSPDGKYLVAGFGSRLWTPACGDANPIRVWDLATRRLIHRLNGHTDYCLALEFSRDGSLLASGGIDARAILWSTANWKAVRTLQNPDKDPSHRAAGQASIDDLAFSPDGKTLAMASREGNVHLWDIGTGKLLDTLRGHSSHVHAVAFSPDGRTLASGSSDQTLRLWNAETQRELMQIDPGRFDLGPIGTLAFSPDGTQLLAGGRSTAFWSAKPLVWNDPDRAAERLRRLLRSNVDFPSRIRMLSDNLRLHEALAKLDTNDVRLRAALAAAQAHWHASRKEWAEAALAFDRLIAADPKDPGAWLRTPGLLRVATALLHRDRPDAAARLLEGGGRRIAQDGILTRGLGLVIEGVSGAARVTGLLPGGPAARAGLVPGDTLMAVGGTVLTGKSNAQLVALLNGEPGTRVRLLVRRPGRDKPEVIALTREWFVADPATLELLQSLRRHVTERLAGRPRDVGLLELRAELGGLSSQWDAQAKDCTAAIQVLAGQPARTVTERLLRVYRRRGDAYANLQKWSEALDDYARVVTPETTDIDLLAKRARAQAALEHWDAATTDFRRALEADPENLSVAADRALMLWEKYQSEKPVGWAVLKPTEMKSDGGARLTLQDDGSVFVQGRRAVKDAYTLDFECVPENVRAIRLEALRDDRLPGGGPGTHGGGGEFVLSEFRAFVPDPSRASGLRPIPFQSACATFEARPDLLALKPGGRGWSNHEQPGAAQTAYFAVARGQAIPGPRRLRIRVEFSHLPGDEDAATLGRLRLAVSSHDDAFLRESRGLAARRMTDPWTRIALAYFAIGDRKAPDPPVTYHPVVTVGIGDMYAADEDRQRTKAELRKLLDHGPDDASLLKTLASYYESAGLMREAVWYLAKVHAADPQDSALLLRLAPLQAWFGQEAEWAATCRRVLASAGQVTDPFVADRIAKVCCLLPSVDKPRIEAALALARKAVELGKRNEWLPWFQMCLGLVEFRTGRFVEADATLLAAANGHPNVRSVASTIAFYRAMTLFRRGMEPEARQLATEAATGMKPLPANEEDPLTEGNDVDDLILWLAYKEAKALIKFDAAPDQPTSPRQ